MSSVTHLVLQLVAPVLLQDGSRPEAQGQA